MTKEKLDKVQWELTSVAIHQQFMALVEEHFVQQHDVAFYETTLNLPTKCLSRHLQKAEAGTPCQILISRQIQEARRLLITTQKTAKAIGFELGFDDPYYFSRVFKLKTGLSPRHYRQQNSPV